MYKAIIKQHNRRMKLRQTIRGTCFAGYYWLTGRKSLLSFVDYLDSLHVAPRQEINVNVHRNLYQLLSHASRTVPYYSDFVDSGKLSEETVVDYLQKLPILTKDIIRRECKQLISEKHSRKTRWNTSGGSTGEPVKLLQDQNMTFQKRVNELLFMRWAGHKMGEKHVLIWGVPQATFNEKISLHERFYRLVHNETYLNCYQITDNLLNNWVRFINEKRPNLIEAYVDAIYELSRFIIREGLHIESPRAIITSAGVLKPIMREVITQAFNCPVLNRYGSREVGGIACSCLLNNELHINEFSHYLEIVDEEGNPCEEGIEGDILITLLTNYTMPLIRYQIQDRGIWASGPCPCGRTTRRLVNVTGRQNDYLIASDGSKINGAALPTLLYPVSGIKRYQYLQVQKDKVVLLVVPDDGFDTDILRKEIQSPLERLKAMLNGLSVQLDIVDEITPSKSGKYRYVLNELAEK